MSRLLLIDDDHELLWALELSLNFAGFDVRIAGTVHEAAVMLREKSFDLVICDLIMPEMNGLEFRRKMAAELHLPPFLFCSGVPLDPIEPPFPPGVAGFLAKPFSVPDLISTMSTVLSTQRATLFL